MNDERKAARRKRTTKRFPGSITKRGVGVWRVRLCVGGKYHSLTVHGTRAERRTKRRRSTTSLRATVAAEAGDCPDPCRIRFTEHVAGQGAAFFRAADAHDLEGIVSKRATSRYRAGGRTRDWLKVKCWRTYELVIGGIERDDDGRVEALLVGSPDGDALRYEGRVEFGLHRARIHGATGQEIAQSPFKNGPSPWRRTWLDPKLGITVERFRARAANRSVVPWR